MVVHINSDVIRSVTKYLLLQRNYSFLFFLKVDFFFFLSRFIRCRKCWSAQNHKICGHLSRDWLCAGGNRDVGGLGKGGLGSGKGTGTAYLRGEEGGSRHHLAATTHLARNSTRKFLLRSCYASCSDIWRYYSLVCILVCLRCVYY